MTGHYRLHVSLLNALTGALFAPVCGAHAAGRHCGCHNGPRCSSWYVVTQVLCAPASSPCCAGRGAVSRPDGSHSGAAAALLAPPGPGGVGVGVGADVPHAASAMSGGPSLGAAPDTIFGRLGLQAGCWVIVLYLTGLAVLMGRAGNAACVASWHLQTGL